MSLALAPALLDLLRRRAGRLAAGVEDALGATLTALEQGHICLPLPAWAAAGGLDLTDLRHQLTASGVVGAPGDFQPFILDRDRLYLARQHHHEARLAHALLARAARLDAPAEPAPLRARLAALFAYNTEAPDWQRLAAATACLRGLTVIAGGPGTGKTSTVVRLLAALQDQHDGRLRIALAAPTGKAAARLQESIQRALTELPALPPAVSASLPTRASTLHRLLGARPASGEFRHHATNPLAVDVLVVDEASMLGLGLLARTVDALPPAARLILLGDREQLASVEPGAAFADLCDAAGGRSPAMQSALAALADQAPPIATTDTDAIPATPLGDCVVTLRRSHRFHADSAIGALAREVNAGDAEAMRSLLATAPRPDLAWQPGPLDALTPALVQRLHTAYADYLASARDPACDHATVFRHFHRFRLLTAHRDGPDGVEGLNRLVETRVLGRHAKDPAWYPGRPVLIQANDYPLKLYNGDIGLTRELDGQLRVVFEAEDGGYRSLAPGRLPAHETAYAMTVHKSQGSEFDTVLLWLPPPDSLLLNRALVYTGITRAKARIELWGPEASLGPAVQAAPPRASGLRDRLSAIDPNSPDGDSP